MNTKIRFFLVIFLSEGKIRQTNNVFIKKAASRTDILRCSFIEHDLISVYNLIGLVAYLKNKSYTRRWKDFIASFLQTPLLQQGSI